VQSDVLKVLQLPQKSYIGLKLMYTSIFNYGILPVNQFITTLAT